MDWKIRIYGIIQPGDEDSRSFEYFIMGLIVLNVMAVVLDTVNWIYVRYSTFFHVFEAFSIAVFSLEYILRVWTCTVDPRFRHPVKGRFHYMITPLAIIDLLAVLPFYLYFILPDMRFLRVVRLFRLFRVLKLARYSEALQTFFDVLKLKKEEMVIMVFTILILLIIFSSLLYEAEHAAQPEAFSSIPAAMWWGIVTLTTVGYGDLYPKTVIGKFIGSIVVILGIGLFALPAGVLASGFAEVLQRKKEEKRKQTVCPHCGRNI